MKAIVYKKYGAADVLQLAQVAKPEPANDEIRVRVHAVEATKADCEMRSFKFAVKWFWLPLRIALGVTKPKKQILGGYFAGVVDAVGKDVSKFKPGDQVFGASRLLFGGYGEYVCIPSSYTIAPKPDNMSFAEAAAVPLGGLNALHFMRKANIRKGTVKGCRDGVVVDGLGHHKFFKIKAVENGDEGFVINSDDNRLTFNRASDNGDNGFYFMGNNNWFVKNRAEKNGDEGFYGPSEAGQNKIYMNRAIGNKQDGIQVVGHENRVIHNLAKDNGYDYNGDVYKNGYDGFEIDGDRNFVYKNRSFNNSLSGFEVDGRENKILKNRAKQNMQNGIIVENKTDTVDNLISRNIAKENAVYDIFVVKPYTAEAHTYCERQTWKKNRFDSSNMDCIQ